MKKFLVVLATFIAAFAAGFQTYAAVGSLPIGSVEKVLNHELANTWQISVNVKATSDAWQSASFLFMDAYRSYTKADGSEESINALCQRAVATGDQTELKALLQKMMRESVRVSVDTNDPTLQGKTIQIHVDGQWQPDPTNWLQNVDTFAAGNEFVLDGSVPETAYEIDMNKAVTAVRINQGFWIDGVVRAVIRDTQGNVLERDTAASWITTASVIGISNAYVFGKQPGVVQLWYLDGIVQTFNLVDGSLLYSLAPGELRVDIYGPRQYLWGSTNVLNYYHQGPGVTIAVTGSPGSVIVESSEGSNIWKGLTILTNTLKGAAFMSDEIVATNTARFYRARRLNVGGN